MGNKILLLGAIRGLVSEGGRVAEVANGFSPDVVAISISKEGLEAMKKRDGTTPEKAEPTNPEEEMYINGLSEFGEVVKPPPCFSEAMKHAMRKSIPVEPLDMDDEHYTAAYCKYITTLDMIRQGGSGKKFSRYVFTAETPLEFVKEWDELVNRLSSYRELENAREEWMAKGLHKLSSAHNNILAVIEFERVGGVEKHLRALGCEPEVVQP